MSTDRSSFSATTAGPAVGWQPSRTAALSEDRRDGLGKRSLVSLVAVACLGLGVGGWAITAELSGAVIAPGQIVVDESSKTVQHPSGGIVNEIRVVNGQRVNAGTVLLRLDATQSVAQYEVIAGRLLTLEGERARLSAERNRGREPEFGGRLAAGDPRGAAIVERERAYFDVRRSLLESQKSRLEQRIEQARREMAAIDAQRAAKARETALIRRELAVVEELNRKQLANLTRLTDMERQLARFEGEEASLAAQHARAQAHLHEVALQVLELEQRAITDAHKELREVEARIEELVEREKVARDQMVRAELRSPVTGVVHELAAQTVGGVVRAGETIMKIVPDAAALVVEARVAPSDIDHVAVGRRATLRLTALDQRSTPEVAGIVSHVGADASREAQTGRTFFSIRVTISEGELARIGRVKLVPGMPVETFVETAPRTFFAYITKPLRDNFSRAMREP